jgi:hypothetical protein
MHNQVVAAALLDKFNSLEVSRCTIINFALMGLPSLLFNFVGDADQLNPHCGQPYYALH